MPNALRSNALSLPISPTPFSKFAIGILIGWICSSPPVTAESVSKVGSEIVDAPWAEAWQDDLRYLARRIPQTHPNPFHFVPEEDFEAEIDRLIEAVPSLAHHLIVFEVAKLMAKIRDGHTRLTLPLPESAGFFRSHAKTPAPKIPGLLFYPLPIRFYVLPDYLVLPKILHAAGVITEIGPVEIEVELADGSLSTLRLAATSALDESGKGDTQQEPVWTTATPSQARLLSLENRDRHPRHS